MKIVKLLFLMLLMLGYAGCSSSDGIDDNMTPDDEQSQDDDSTSGSDDDGSDDDDDGSDGDQDPNEGLSTTPADIYFKDLEADAANATLTTYELILKAIKSVPEGGIIEFEAKEYDLTQSLTLEKSVVLRGVGSLPEDVVTIGTGVIETVFNIASGANITINATATDAKFESLKLLSDSSNSTLISFKGEVSGFTLINVALHNTTYQLSPRSGMTPGLRCENVSFNDFGFRGFFTNRDDGDYALYNKIDKMMIYRCAFNIADATRSNSRAISIDAGNTEYPNIMDFDGMEMRECHFNDCSFASSKCQNFNIIDCTFYVKDVHDYPIHLEEYTRNINIEGCTFTCDNTAEILIGVADYSSITDNTVIGTCKGFVQGQSCEYFDIEDNDLSQMSSTAQDINLWGSSGCRYISIKNNKAKSVTVKNTTELFQTVTIDEPSATVTKTTVSGYTFPYAEGNYRIKNKSTGKYLTATTLGYGLISSSSASISNSDVWTITQVWPNRYELKNKGTGGYLFVVKGGESEDPGTVLSHAPMTQYFSSDERKPIWNITEETGSGGYCPLIPGGDDTSLVRDTGLIQLLAKDKSASVTEASQLWVLEQE